MFSCEFCKISKYTFFTEHLRTTASVRKPTFELQIFHVITTFLQSSEAATGGVLLKKVFLKISLNFIGEHLCKGLFFNKVGGLRPTLLKGEFPVNFAKFLRRPIWQNTSRNALESFRTFTLKTISEAVVRRCSVKKVFLEISQNSQGNPCASGQQFY